MRPARSQAGLDGTEPDGDGKWQADGAASNGHPSAPSDRGIPTVRSPPATLAGRWPTSLARQRPNGGGGSESGRSGRSTSIKGF